MASTAELHERSIVDAPAVLEASPRIEFAVHDASRLGWQAIVPLPKGRRAAYSFELEVEVPTNLVGILDPWARLQSYARLVGAEDTGAAREPSVEAFRRSVVVVSSRLARARDGFMRHCTLLRSSATDENHWHPLALWVSAASTELANARCGPLRTAPRNEERLLADEFLSLQLWTVLTDCGRALQDARRALEGRDGGELSSFASVEAALAIALKNEIAYRHNAQFALAEPINIAQLERLLARMRWLNRRFEHVLFLDVESYEVERRLSGWFSALAATLKGRAQRIFAQRVTRYRLPKDQQLANDRQRGAVLAAARESFSQSGTQRSDPTYPDVAATHDVTVLRFVHRGLFARAAARGGVPASQVWFIYRFDLSALFPRLHDAVPGFASMDARTGRIAIVDVPRNYALPLRSSLRWAGQTCIDRTHTVVLNRKGLLRIETENR
jgi:hypothetical protein